MPDASPPPPTLADLSPANFAIVMASGIVGIAAGQQGQPALALFMLAFCVLAWLAVAGLTGARLLLHRRRLCEDLRSHQRAPGFLTAVAGTGVLGSQFVLFGADTTGQALAGLALLLWIVLTYGVLLALVLQQEKPPLQEGINGGWLLVVVATQSIAVVAALIAAQAPPPARLALNFGALVLWLCGGMLYVWLIALIFYRFAFFRLGPQELTPPYWINMGAVAISTLAGALLVLNAAGEPLLLELMPFVKSGTVLYWAVGTWWIPLLVGLGVWRYLVRRHPLRYDTAYWGAVFPLGMYSAATHQASLALGLRFLAPLARGFFYIALAAWLLVTLGLVRHMLRVARGYRQATPG